MSHQQSAGTSICSGQPVQQVSTCDRVLDVLSAECWHQLMLWLVSAASLNLWQSADVLSAECWHYLQVWSASAAQLRLWPPQRWSQCIASSRCVLGQSSLPGRQLTLGIT